MQIESFECVCVCVCKGVFDMVQQARKWKISVEMRHRGRLASALSTVITKTPSEDLVFSTQSSGTVLRAEGDEINIAFSISSEHSRELWENNAFPLTVILSLATQKCSVTVNHQKDLNFYKIGKTLSLQFQDCTRTYIYSRTDLNARCFFPFSILFVLWD